MTDSLEAIPYLDLKPQYLALESQIQTRIAQVLDHTGFILGPEVEESEAALAHFVGAKYCLTAASGTDALLMALMALDIKPGDEVITTAFSFFATAEVISLLGAKPVFADIDPVTYNLDAASVETQISPKTKAIMPVSLYGQPYDVAEFLALSKKYGIPIIEDAAQSFGATHTASKTRSGSMGLIGATSFFPAKPLGCYGDGGAIFTNDDALYSKMKVIRTHGQESRYHHTVVGINGRLDTLQCAILTEKLKRYPEEIKMRDAIAMRYNDAFASLGDRLVLPEVKSDRSSVWAQYTLLVKNRQLFAEKLKQLGVPTSVHYPSPLHWQPVYRELKVQCALPIAEQCSSQCISLPLYADMPEKHVSRVIAAVQQVLD